MNDADFEKLKTDEAMAYDKFHAQDEISNELASKWVRLKQAMDREILRREIKADMTKELPAEQRATADLLAEARAEAKPC